VEHPSKAGDRSLDPYPSGDRRDQVETSDQRRGQRIEVDDRRGPIGGAGEAAGGDRVFTDDCDLRLACLTDFQGPVGPVTEQPGPTGWVADHLGCPVTHRPADARRRGRVRKDEEPGRYPFGSGMTDHLCGLSSTPQTVVNRAPGGSGKGMTSHYHPGCSRSRLARAAQWPVTLGNGGGIYRENRRGTTLSGPLLVPRPVLRKEQAKVNVGRSYVRIDTPPFHFSNRSNKTSEAPNQWPGANPELRVPGLLVDRG